MRQEGVSVWPQCNSSGSSRAQITPRVSRPLETGGPLCTPCISQSWAEDCPEDCHLPGEEVATLLRSISWSRGGCPLLEAGDLGVRRWHPLEMLT